MKKKLLLTLLSTSLAAGTVGALALVKNENSSLRKKEAVSGTFYLDKTSIKEESDYYTAVALDDGEHSVKTKFVNMSFDDENDELSFAHGQAGWFTNIDPVRGFDSLSVSFEDYASGFGSVYFSSNELNITDIFAGNYANQDLFCLPIRSVSTQLTLYADDYPQLLDSRFVLFFFNNTDDSNSLTLSNLSFDSHCDAPVNVQEGGQTTGYRTEYLEYFEDQGFTDIFSGFLLANGSYTVSTMPLGYETLGVQDMMGVSSIMNKIYTTLEGYSQTYNANMGNEYVMYFQKGRGEEQMPYTIALDIQLEGTYCFVDIICSTVIPYMEADTEWPRDKIIAGGASEDLVDAFAPFNIPNMTYMYQTKYSTVQEDCYLVGIDAGESFDTTSAKEAVDAYIQNYQENVGYSVNISEWNSLSVTIEKLNSNYALYIVIQDDNYSFITVELIEYRTYDHLPLAEFKAYYQQYHESEEADIMTTDYVLSGNFHAKLGMNIYIGSNINQSDLVTFINHFTDDGYMFVGDYKNGEIISPIERMYTYLSRFDFSFTLVDTNTYMFNVNVGQNRNETSPNLDEVLRRYSNSSTYCQEILSVARNSGSPLLNLQSLPFVSGTGKYCEETYTLKGVDSTIISDFMAMFNSEDLSVTNVRDDQYRITIENSDDPYAIGHSVYFQFKIFYIAGIRMLSYYFVPEDRDFTYSYSQVNSNVSSYVGSSYYVPLPNNNYKFEDYGFSFHTLGTLDEMEALRKTYISLIEAKGIYNYDEYSDSYINVSAQKTVKVELTGYTYNLHRLDVSYGTTLPDHTMTTYANSGLASCSFINDNFGALPQLSGEKAYLILSETSDQVQVAVNKHCEIYNYYLHTTLKNNGFNGAQKIVGNTVYYLETASTWDYWILTFTAKTLLDRSGLLSALGDNATHLDSVFHFSNDYKYRIVAGPWDSAGEGGVTMYIYGTTQSKYNSYLQTLGFENDEYETEDYSYGVACFSNPQSVQLTINWTAKNSE